MNPRYGIALIVGVGLSVSLVPAQQSVVDSPHNLSVTGTGAVRAATEEQVCIFCHTPHRAAAATQLWNRAAPSGPYRIYESTSLDADPGQPTGASKRCLSCHDGSIALGNVLSRDGTIAMRGGASSIPQGASHLGTDLSDDHPISFLFDSRLAARDTRLVHPSAIPAHVPLEDGELQCTSCHDPHDNAFGHFLVMDNTDSALCAACHTIDRTTIAAHADCASCHQMHSAPSGPFLLQGATVDATCLTCHDADARLAMSIGPDLAKPSVHDRGGTTGCSDCHEPHTMLGGIPSRAPEGAGNLGLLPVGHGGAVASTEYDVCLDCHGETRGEPSPPLVQRQVVRSSIERQFDPAAASFHPIKASGLNPNVPSLRPEWSEGDLLLCSDCHGSDTSRKAGGGGPNGVHGSLYSPLLLARYDQTDYTPESASAYALCYRCHEREGAGGILRDESFPHSAHVVDAQTPCSVCHDAHGVDSLRGNRLNNSHLINFDTTVVFPDPVRGLIEFVDTGMFSGSCTLSCHGVAHDRTTY